MDSFDLISAVQPSEGWFAVVGIGAQKKVIQKLVATRKEFDATVAAYASKNYDVYFGVAKFETDKSRTKANVLALKSFWLDIDVGDEKARVNPRSGKPQGYIDQKAALVALHNFCITTGLVFPTVVNSGRGVHAYWTLTEAVTKEEWEPVASRLRELCIQHSFYVDPAVFDVARILRVPGTMNYKAEPPLPVTVMAVGVTTDLLGMRKQLEVHQTEVRREKVLKQLTALGQSMLPPEEASFRRIIEETARGQGCQQLGDSVLNNATLSEPRWFDALSIAKHCIDKDKAIEVLSSGHKDYDPYEAEVKTRHIVGPHTCAQFERNNPGGCAGCPKQGAFLSPIALGRPLRMINADLVINDKPHFKVPDGYVNGTGNGGVYKLSENGNILVIHYPIYILKRMREPSVGDVAVIKLEKPVDPWTEITVPNAVMTDAAELRKRLAAEGVVCPIPQFMLITRYLFDAITELQLEEQAEQMRQQFGWMDDGCFIAGDREYSAGENKYSPPSISTKAIAEHMKPAGTLEAWQEVFNLYGAPGLEPLAFAALTGFGAPLMKFTGQKGLIINLIHPQSGTGKTTALHMCNSIWGAPDRLCAVAKDTFNSKVMRLGMMNNLPFTVDEITNTTAMEFSDLAYNMSQGRGKDRVKSSANEMRDNLSSWQTLSLCSSNASFYEKLAAAKNAPAGENMRLMEYKVDHKSLIDPRMAKEMFDHQLMENYGHAGAVYAQYLVDNRDEVAKKVVSMQKQLDLALGFTASERIWSAGVAANITGGMIASELGLHSWDMQRILSFAASVLTELRQDVKQPTSSATHIIGAYINNHINNMLVIDGLAAKPFPASEPKGALLVRHEPDTGHTYIPVSELKTYCSDMSISYKTVLEELKTSGALLATTSVSLSKGMKLATPPVLCIKLNAALVGISIGGPDAT